MKGNEPHNEDHPAYFPPELVNHLPDKSKTLYHCYLIELRQKFNYDATVQDIILAMRSELEADICGMPFELEVPRGLLSVNVRYVGEIHLGEEQVSCFINLLLDENDSFEHCDCFCSGMVVCGKFFFLPRGALSKFTKNIEMPLNLPLC